MAKKDIKNREYCKQCKNLRLCIDLICNNFDDLCGDKPLSKFEKRQKPNNGQ